MANEGWSYATTGGAPACSTAPVTTHYTDAAEPSTSATSTDFQPPSLHLDGAAPSFQLADPHMDWTMPAYMGGRAADVAATMSSNAFLQLYGDDAGGRLLLDHQTPLHVQAQYDYDIDVTAPVAAAPRMSTSMYAANQCSSSVRSFSDMRAAAMMMTKLFPQQQFSTSPGIFEPALEPPPILSQAGEYKHLNEQPKTDGVQEACSSVKRRSSLPDSPAAVKKRRIEMQPPLPTFQVRKEKLGDRITALQQLDSPFGKTDTASVLHEAIEYIKFLHNQVASLSSPYLRFGSHVQIPQQQDSTDAGNDEVKDDLRSRGLCLVPLASTYTVANERWRWSSGSPHLGAHFDSDSRKLTNDTCSKL